MSTRKPEQHDLFVAVTRLANLLNRRLAPVFESAELTPQQWIILAALSGCGPSSLAGLARAMMVSKQNMTGMIGRLEEAGYVKRDEHPSDLRSARVMLSPRGKRVLEKLREDYEGWLVELTEEIGERDLAVTERVIAKLIAKLE